MTIGHTQTYNRLLQFEIDCQLRQVPGMIYIQPENSIRLFLYNNLLIACRAMSCAMSGQKSRHCACSETWLGPRFPHQDEETSKPMPISSQILVELSFDKEVEMREYGGSKF